MVTAEVTTTGSYTIAQVSHIIIDRARSKNQAKKLYFITIIKNILYYIKLDYYRWPSAIELRSPRVQYIIVSLQQGL